MIRLLVLLIFFQLILPQSVFAHATGLAGIEGTVERKVLKAKFKYPDKVFTVGPDLVTDFFRNYFEVSNKGKKCDVTTEPYTIPTDTATLVYTCPDEITDLKIHSELSENIGYTYPSSFKKDNIVKNFTFDLEKRDFEAEFTAQAWLKDLTSKIYDFVKLGMFHIYTGYDHILFLLAVIMVLSSFKRIIKAVTAFTIAHSTTLILSAFGGISLTSRIVEPIIALSIAYVALENIFFLRKKTIGVTTIDRRWFVAFGFGLIHGLGFAGALREINIPKNELLVDLVSFNIGIELGQLSIIALVLPLLYFLNRFRWKNKLLLVFSLLIGLAGVFWFFERIGILGKLPDFSTQSVALVALAFVLGFIAAGLLIKPKTFLSKLKDLARKIAVLVSVISITVVFIPGIFNLKPQKAYAAIPSGVIVMWPSTNASIPSGWSRVTALDGRYPKMIATSGTNPGATGGASSHNHSFGSHTHGTSHSHSWNSWPAYTSSSFPTDRSLGSSIAAANHTHSASDGGSSVTSSSSDGTVNYDSATTEPQHLEVIFIKSDGTPTGIPNGALAYYNSAAPSGWARYTTGDNRLLKGAATAGNGGGTGGSGNSHTHTSTGHTHTTGSHTHTVVAGAPATQAGGPAGTQSHADSSHSSNHNVTSGSTAGATSSSTAASSDAGDMTPPWTKMLLIENTSGSASQPATIIAIWDGTLASIPSGWLLADGNSSTPNLSNSKFVRSSDSNGNIGTTGGSTTHTHGGSHTHTSNVGSHTHTQGTTNQSGQIAEAWSGSFDAAPNHNHSDPGSSGAASMDYGSASITSGANGSNDPVFTGIAYIQGPSNQNPNAPTIMGSSPIPGSKPNKNATTITLQGTATDADASDTVQIDWDYSSNSGGAWTNIGTTSLGAQGATLSLSWTVSGLTALSTYRLRARTIDNGGATSSYTTQSSDWTLTSGCSPPVSGNLTIAASCAFPETVDGVDAGNITINSSVTLTINASQTVVFNSAQSITVNGSTAVNSTGQVRQTNLWMVDSDADGWPASATQTGQDSTPGGTYRRRNLLNSDRIIDCNDAASSSTNSC